MRKRIFAFLLSAALLLSFPVFSYAAQPEANGIVDYKALYAPTLEYYYRLFAGHADLDDLEDDDVGIREAMLFQDTGTILNSIGFSVIDLSGDDIPELVIGYMPLETGEMQYGNVILNVHTLKDDVPVFSFGGWSRNSYALMTDGNFYNLGSAGALYSILGIYSLTPDGSGLDCIDYYFTHETDETFQNVSVFYNTEGQFDVASSKELDMSLDDFWQMSEVLHQQTVLIDMTSFAEEFGLPSSIEAEWDDSEDRNEAHVLFEPINGAVKDFKLLSIQAEDVDETGAINFAITDEKSYGDLEPNYPITISMTFIGDLPNNGISYIDSTGCICRFSLSISGEDGSLILIPF